MKNYQKHFESATGRASRPGNHIAILQNGNEIFSSMLEAIRGAETSIEFTTYVYWRSHIATEFADALIERARAGVRVSLLIDAIGGAVMSTRTVGALERAGVKVAWFRPMWVGHLRRLNHRTHRKILLVDGRIGFTGGVGIADQWDGDAQGPGNWRETHCRIEGPACLDLHDGFTDNWLDATGQRLATTITPAKAGTTDILTTLSTNYPRPTGIERLFDAAIATATQRLWITTAYFVPTAEHIQALSAAVARGVDVRVLTNGPHTNHKLTRRAGQASYEALIENGVRIYEYQRTVLHVKLITVDGQWATIGSANFDSRSLVLNDELNISITGADFVGPLDRQFIQDIKISKHISIAYWQRRHWYDRVLEAGSRAFSSQL